MKKTVICCECLDTVPMHKTVVMDLDNVSDDVVLDQVFFCEDCCVDLSRKARRQEEVIRVNKNL